MATVDVIANRSSGTEALGKAYFETDTNSFIVYNGSGWVELQSDGVGSALPFNEYSVDFNGTSDFVSTGLDVGGASALTVSAWIKHDDLTATSPNLLNQYAGGGSNRAFRFSMYAGTASWQGLLCSLYTSDGLKEANYLLNPIISTGTWYHTAFVFDGTSAKVYFNGDNSQASATITWSNSATLNNNGVQVLIGGGAGVNKYLDGNMDEVGIWTSALSASDITAIYNSGNGPTDISTIGNSGNGPDAWYRMGDDINDSPVDGGNVTGIQDSSGNGNHATTVANSQPTFSTDVPEA